MRSLIDILFPAPKFKPYVRVRRSPQHAWEYTSAPPSKTDADHARLQEQVGLLQKQLEHSQVVRDDLSRLLDSSNAALRRERTRHTKASHRCNLLKQEAEEARTHEAAVLARIPALEEQATTGINEVARKLRASENNHFEACRALAGALWGPDAEPIFDGPRIAPGWPGIASKRADELRQQNIALKSALMAFVPWFNQVLRRHQDDATIILSMGQAPGSLHELVVRRKDIRVVREIIENIR